jgi:hypothetical protein
MTDRKRIEAERDIAQEILDAVREIKAGGAAFCGRSIPCS